MKGYILTVEVLLALYGSELNIKVETRRTLRPDGFQFYLESYVRAILYRRGRRPRRPEPHTQFQRVILSEAARYRCRIRAE